MSEKIRKFCAMPAKCSRDERRGQRGSDHRDTPPPSTIPRSLSCSCALLYKLLACLLKHLALAMVIFHAEARSPIQPGLDLVERTSITEHEEQHQHQPAPFPRQLEPNYLGNSKTRPPGPTKEFVYPKTMNFFFVAVPVFEIDDTL